MRGDERVYQEMRAGLEAEEESYRQEMLDFQEHMQQNQENARVKHELKEAKAELQKARKQARAAEAVVTAMDEVKVYSLEMLGKGRKNTGILQHQRTRLEVLERLRRAAELSAEQTSQWEYFKTSWDQVMAEAHGQYWPKLFVQLVQNKCSTTWPRDIATRCLYSCITRLNVF